MLQKFKNMLRVVQAQRRHKDLEGQIECAEMLRDMMSVARKTKKQVILTVEVSGLRQGVVLAGDGKEVEWLYNFAAGQAIGLKADRYQEQQSAAQG